MQSTGQTSTQALSLTLMQGSAITYAIPASLVSPLLGNGSTSVRLSPGKLTYTYQLVPRVSSCPREPHSLNVGPLADSPNPPEHPGPLPAISERAQLRIERVPKRVAEEVEGEDRQADRETREDRHPRRRLGEVHRCAAQHQSPRRRRLLDAEPQEGQGSLEQDGLAEKG